MVENPFWVLSTAGTPKKKAHTDAGENSYPDKGAIEIDSDGEYCPWTRALTAPLGQGLELGQGLGILQTSTQGLEDEHWVKEQKDASKNAPKKAKVSKHGEGEKENQKVDMAHGGQYQKCLFKGI
ncbi:hypothetical protein B0H19DRAFT_1058837 [Mycena capillaripes]|nr:hypothetical protein B0H19DRAFT_1058837 [Mycena capillaripes]